jgi:hypothetical protein
MQNQFKIVSVERVSDGQVKVRVRMDAKAWHKLAKAGDLGFLYGVDISNEAYRAYGVKASNPTVSDRDRAQGGLKWIDLYYTDETWTPAIDNVIHVDFIAKKRKAA